MNRIATLQKLDQLERRIRDIEDSNRPMQEQFVDVFKMIHELLAAPYRPTEKTDESV